MKKLMMSVAVIAASLTGAAATAETVTIQSHEVTMGESGKAPPNARAASSNGTKTVTTTTTVSGRNLTEARVERALSGGRARGISVSTSTSVTDLPGKSR